ncbi:MAG: AAA family ATPase [Actinomycetes bacterium]
MATNPFRYTGPVGIDDLIDRDDETDELLRTSQEGNNARLVAPRRFGKTSLLRRVAGEAEAGGWTSVYVDFFGVLSITDVTARIESAYAAALTGTMSRWFAGARRTLRPAVQVGGAGLPVRAGISLEEQRTGLEERLALPVRVHQRTGRRVLVVFDEFQDVLVAGRNVDATIRSVIQHHQQVAAYVFAGSHTGMMTELFADPARAFYQQARPVALPPLPPEATATFLGERFSTTGKEIGEALPGVLDAAAGHPQRTILLAHELWALTRPGRAADPTLAATALDAALAGLADEFRERWARLPAAERRVLAALAQGQGPYSRSVSPADRGRTTQATLQALAARGDILRAGSGARGMPYAVVDPFFAEWIRRGRSGW